ncbi:hypothetical protein [Streptomyces sp. NPDC052225]|uniref:hypothetical protein n=1 Tax=Streptomyces sp. NPDC052225 TaxID=3154949 RepID=UPI00344A749B
MSEQMTAAQAQLEDARRQKAEADDLIAALEERVQSGGEEVTALEMGERYGVQRLAALQQRRAEQLVADAEAADLERRRQEAEETARQELEALSPEVLADACEAALKAIDEVQRLAADRQAATRRHADTFIDLGMSDRIVHRDGGWVVFEAGGGRYDTHENHFTERALLAVIEGERNRRKLIPGRRAKGFTDPEPDRHIVAQLLAAKTDVTTSREAA